MSSNRTLHPKSETILVASLDSALATAGNLVTGNTINLLDGQLGVISATHGNTIAYNDFLAAGNTLAMAPAIKIVQGTPFSADTTQVGKYGIEHKAFVESALIDGRNKVTLSVQVAQQPTNDIWVLGDIAANPGSFNVQSASNYVLNIAFNSSRQDRFFSTTGVEIFSPQYVTPDYTALGTVDPLDHLVQNMALQVNLNSAAFQVGSEAREGNKNVVAFAVNIAGGAGTALSAFTAGATVPVMTVDGITYNIVVDEDMAASMVSAIANSVLAATSTIEVINTLTAGSAANTDSIVLMALDHKQTLLKDRFMNIKPRLFVGLDDTFNGNQILKVRASKNYEGHGQGRKWQIQYESRPAMQHWSAQNHPNNSDFWIEAPTYIDPAGVYSAYIIESKKDDLIVNYSHRSQRPDRTIILTPATYAGGTTNATFLTSLNAVLGAWLQSVETAGNMESKIGTGAAPNYFV